MATPRMDTCTLFLISLSQRFVESANDPKNDPVVLWLVSASGSIIDYTCHQCHHTMQCHQTYFVFIQHNICTTLYSADTEAKA